MKRMFVLLSFLGLVFCAKLPSQDNNKLTRVHIADLEARDSRHAQVVGASLQFWLKRSDSIKLVGKDAAQVILNARVIVDPQDPDQVRLVVSIPGISFVDERSGESDDLGFFARQAANLVHKRLTGKWLRPVASGEKLTPRDTVILEASDPIQQIAPAKPTNADPQPQKINVTLSVDRGTGSTYRFGEKVKITFKVDRECMVKIYNTDNQGVTTLLYPNPYSSSGRVQPDREYTLPGQNEPWVIEVGDTEGVETVTLIATRGDWDYPGKEESSKAITVVSKDLSSFTKSLRAKLKDKEDGFSKATVTFFSVKE